MRAMVLAAGYGERLMPLTRKLPKPAVPVLGRPIALQTLVWLRDHGAEEAVLNLHHLPDVLPRLLESDRPCLPVLHYSHEETILGTAGGLRQARPLFGSDGTLVVVNGDILTDIDLAAALDAHRRSGLPATLVVSAPRAGYATVEVDAGGRVRSLAGAPDVPPDMPTEPHLFTGCHILEDEALDLIPGEGRSEIVRDVYRPLAAAGRLGSFRHDGFWWEFGSPALYRAGSLELLRRSHEAGRRLTDHDPVHREGDALVAAGAGARWDPTARLEGSVALGFASQVGPRARLADTLVLPESWIGPGAELERSIVAPGVEVPIGFRASDALLVPAETGEAKTDDLPTVLRIEDAPGASAAR